MSEKILISVRLLAASLIVVGLTLVFAAAILKMAESYLKDHYRLIRLCRGSTQDLFLRSDGVRVLKPFIDSEEETPVDPAAKNEDVCQ